jgi:hypothetical protein
MSWHGDTALFERYADGDADAASAASLEAHVLRCERCRADIAAFVPAPALEAGWDRIVAELDARPPGLVERSLVRAGVPDHVARLLAATPSLRTSWLGAVAIALAFAVLAARTGDPGTLLFLIVAPLVPLTGVAVAFGPGVDPTYEIGLAAPMRTANLLLIRALAVLASSTALAGLAALLLPVLNWTAAAWLVPSLALTAATLALASAMRPLVAAGAVAATWVALAVLWEAVAEEPLAAFHVAGQTALLLVAAVGAVVFARRRQSFETRRGG